MFGTTGVVDAPGAGVNEEEKVDHTKTGEREDGLSAEVGRPQGCLVSAQKRPPGIMRAIGGIGNSRRSQNPPHGASSDTSSEFESLPLDARIAPTDVLARKAKDEIADAFADPWPSMFHAGFSSSAAFGVSYPSLGSLGLDNGDDILNPLTEGKAYLQQPPSLFSTSRWRAWS